MVESAAGLSRCDRILLLAASVDDYLPGPWMGRGGWSAEGPSERRKCKRCNGEGRVRTRKGSAPCEVCGAKGFVLVDAYTGRMVAKEKEDEFALSLAELRGTLEAEQADRESRRRRRERVDYLLGPERDDGESDEAYARRLLNVGLYVGEDWADWMLRRKRALWRAGDYELLERRLRELARLNVRLASAFVLVYGPGAELRVAGPRLRAGAEQALDWLESVLPREIRVPSWLLVPRSRDDEILELAAGRWTQAAIAERLGVSQATVSRRLRVLTAV